MESRALGRRTRLCREKTARPWAPFLDVPCFAETLSPPQRAAGGRPSCHTLARSLLLLDSAFLLVCSTLFQPDAE